MSSYANASTDLITYGLPATALTLISLTVQQAECDAASDVADGYLNGRYEMPLVPPYPISLVMAVCKIAAFNLMSVRGFSMAAGADVLLAKRHDDAIEWLKGVQQQRIHPILTPAADPNGAMVQPKVRTESVIFVQNGQQGPQRGW